MQRSTYQSMRNTAVRTLRTLERAQRRLPDACADEARFVLDHTDALLDRLFGLAARYDLDIDLHVDETNDPRSAALPYVARAALRHNYRDRVTCGHCCSLAVQPDDEADRTIDLLAEAGVAVVTLPTVNLYLQDRGNGRTPRWR